MKVAVYGAGGHGKVVLDILLDAGARVEGFIDEDAKKRGMMINGFEVLGNLSSLAGRKGIAVALGIGNNRIRERTFTMARKSGLKVVSAIHPQAVLSRFASLGEALTVMAGAVINSGTVLEDGAVVNTGATVDHDCRLERFCQIWPGAHLAGNIRVGAYTYVGTGASVIPGIRIGCDVLIGAGAAVASDIPDGSLAVGVPAKPMKTKRTR